MQFEVFGEIDPENLKQYYEREITLAGRRIEVDLNFESDSVEKEVLEAVSKFVKALDVFAKKAFDAISEDYDLAEASDTAQEYLQHHLDELCDSELIKVFGTLDIDKKTYLEHLSLTRIGLYPEDEESFAVFDIHFPKELTDYLMAVTFNDQGELSYISLDS